MNAFVCMVNYVYFTTIRYISEYKASQCRFPSFSYTRSMFQNGRFSEIQLYLLCFDLGDIFPLEYKHFTNTSNISHQILSNQMKIAQLDPGN